jgi:hypothetical protein
LNALPFMDLTSCLGRPQGIRIFRRSAKSLGPAVYLAAHSSGRGDVPTPASHYGEPDAAGRRNGQGVNAVRAAAYPASALALALTAMLAGMPPVALAQGADTLEVGARAKAKHKAKSKSKAKAQAKPSPKAVPDTDGQSDAQAKAVGPDEDKAAAKEMKSPALDQPKLVAFDKLPGPIRKLHSCAGPGGNVELSAERYDKSVLFLVSCPAERGKLTPIAAYLARDAKGHGARRLSFELLGEDGAASATGDTVLSAVVAREAYTAPGDQQTNSRVRNDTPWLSGAWRPEDRPGVCAVAASWRIAGDKAELRYWEEARDCPKDALPKYEIRLDKQPPPLVGR